MLDLARSGAGNKIGRCVLVCDMSVRASMRAGIGGTAIHTNGNTTPGSLANANALPHTDGLGS